ncbi:hypothetical protein ACJIZ3_024342 [Penstemon smallii]|uniref:AT-hook motif nuclear-localized protein n=1 Tax=Penstemon smallii TaxID=265156 RepID=A0ABD3TRJ5_9LAMI
MEMEDKDSTDSGSLGLNSESDSPPSSGAPYGGFGGGAGGGGGSGVLPEVMDMSLEKNAGVTSLPEVAVGGGVIGVMGGGIIGGGGGVGVVAGSGELAMGKKKRGRPRKYDSDGNLRPGYIKSPPVAAAAQSGFTLSTPPSYEYSSGSKRGRGRPSGSGTGTGSGNWQILASLGELFASTAGGDFTPHVVTAYTGEDVAGKILTFAQKGSRGICVLSANGSVSNVTIRQPGSSGGLLTYEGRFEILTLTGSYTVSDNGGMKSRSGGLSVSLASADGRVIGGVVAGMLMAANPIQIVVGSFLPNGYNMKPQKRKYNTENRISHSPAVQCAQATVTAAIPISQAIPVSHNYPIQAPQVPVQSHGEANNNSLSNKDHPNSASTDTSDWNGSGPSSDQRPSPDINISVSLEEH